VNIHWDHERVIAMTDAAGGIERHHHITLCVGTAQEDYDFHTLVLGLKSVKKTALYDGDVPIYHLYSCPVFRAHF
jgi:glyoxalase family protein